jgi:hypothetical protein
MELREGLGFASWRLPCAEVTAFTATLNFRRRSRFLDDSAWVLVLAEADGMSQPVHVGPFQEFNLSDGLLSRRYDGYSVACDSRGRTIGNKNMS